MTSPRTCCSSSARLNASALNGESVEFAVPEKASIKRRRFSLGFGDYPKTGLIRIHAQCYSPDEAFCCFEATLGSDKANRSWKLASSSWNTARSSGCEIDAPGNRNTTSARAVAPLRCSVRRNSRRLPRLVSSDKCATISSRMGRVPFRNRVPMPWRAFSVGKTPGLTG